MVCKEDVLLWFKDLEGYKRIDVMTELLNMCVPFEVRYLGSCIEEIGKHSYHELRGPSIVANDADRLSKDSSLHTGLLDDSTRHRAVIYMSVLSARNCTCANWFYRTLLRTLCVETDVYFKDDNALSELLLLFTMALHHPAFTYEQKTHCGNVLVKLIDIHSERSKMINNNALIGSGHPCFQHGYLQTSRNPNMCVTMETPIIPVKTSSVMPSGENTIPIQHPPPGFPPPHAMQQQHPHLDFMSKTILARPGFTATVVRAPDMHPFPTATTAVTTLENQAGSPPHSRTTSPPPRTFMRPLSTVVTGMSPLIPTNVLLEELQNTTPPVHLDPVPSIPYNPLSDIMKNTDEELNNMLIDDKIRESHWLPLEHFKKTNMNGMRNNTYVLESLIEHQVHQLKLEGDNSLHCSNPTSGNSSSNHSPTETPSVTPAVTPHGPGRGGSIPGGGDSKCRLNGIPPPYIYDLNTTPMPTFSNCSVPYTIAPVPHSRYYTYGPHYTTPYPYQQNAELYPYLVYPHGMNPQPPPPPQPPRILNCYNCGAMGHLGIDCNGQTVEDITQKPYMLEFDSLKTQDSSDK